MPNNEEPIFDFSPLKRFLQQRGYSIGTREAYVPFKPEDVKPADIRNGSMSFTADGIFVRDQKTGSEHRVFLYKKPYHLQRYGKPRFHICKCQVIDEFIESGGFQANYVRANAEPVPVVNLDNFNRVEEIEGLPLCTYCRKMLEDFEDSTEFITTLRAAQNQQQQETEVDIFGYAREWEHISKTYREKRQFTCEQCGLHIVDEYDHLYMHVHHLDGNKLNNHEDNLRCLCYYCHSNVNEHHQKRLRTGANQYVFNDFLEKYAETASWGNNDSEFKQAYEAALTLLRNKQRVSKKEVEKLYPLSPSRLITKLVDNGVATYNRGVLYLKN